MVLQRQFVPENSQQQKTMQVVSVCILFMFVWFSKEMNVSDEKIFWFKHISHPHNLLQFNLCLTITSLWANSADDKLMISRKWALTFYGNCLLTKETISVKCQSLFSRKNKKNVLKCCLLKFLSSMLIFKTIFTLNFGTLWVITKIILKLEQVCL